MSVIIISTLPIHIRKLNDLKNKEKVLREASLNSLALVSNRIQQKGLDSENSSIGGGSYSYWYEKQRQEKGLQTAYIDLTYSNQMMSNFKVLDYKNGYALGFDNSFAGQKANWNEERFGKIFALTNSEFDIVLKAIIIRINKIINNG